MKSRLSASRLLFLPILLFLIFSCSRHEHSESRISDFNAGWSYVIGDPSDAAATEIDVSEWREVDLPHDWSIEDYEIQDGAHDGPFYRDLPGGKDVGYLRDGVAWYRKTFSLPRAAAKKRVLVLFDGVQTQSEVWVNGTKAGENVYGYAPFDLDITPLLNDPGRSNVMAVRTENTGENSRWFAGAGIFRDVELMLVNPVFIPPHGVQITTPEVTGEKAMIRLEVEIVNLSGTDAKTYCKGRIIAPGGAKFELVSGQETARDADTLRLLMETTISDPQLWGPEDPAMYMAEVQLMTNDQESDQVTETFGIRSITYSPEEGLLLNGNSILLKGACMHHDNGLLGAAAFKDAEYRRVRIMKENGFNAIRTSHNPPSTYFLEACDELGMLVIDEAFDHWVKPKRPNDYSNYFREWHKRDIQAMVKRDRNHPSVIMWSFGNEVQERADPEGIEIGKQLIKAIREMDNTRPVTQAVCGFWDNPGKTWDYSAGAFAICDIGGYNYQWENYEADHTKHPERIMYGSESVPKQAWENWEMVEKHSYVVGDFVWTGMDYIGESGIGHATVSMNPDAGGNFLQPWPWYVSWCGDIDITGQKKPQSYFRDVIWGESDLEMLVHSPVPSGLREQVSFWGWPHELKSWNWQGHQGDSLQVTIYSRLPEVKLELNGETIAVKRAGAKAGYTATFSIPYQPGTLKAIGLKEGKAVVSEIIRTTGPPAHINAEPEKSTIDADRNSLAFVNVNIRDEKGLPVPDAAPELTVKVSGPAELMAAGNGAPEHEGSFTDNRFRLFRGKGLIILRSTGETGDIMLNVTGDGFDPVSVRIVAE